MFGQLVSLNLLLFMVVSSYEAIQKLPREFLDKILYGTGTEAIDFEYESPAGIRKFKSPFEGVIPTLERRHRETKES